MPRETPQEVPRLSHTEARLQSYLERDGDDRRHFRIALTCAAAFHLGLLLVQQPEVLAVDETRDEPRRVHVMETVRFKPPTPTPEPEPLPPPEPPARKVPVPDPTPDEPEPVVAIEPQPIVVPDVPVVRIAPPPPPPEPTPAVPEGPLHLAAHIEKPVRLHAVQPRYTEIARKTRTQGVVILQTVIDVEGRVTDVEVLRGLPMGLTEEAVRAVREWRFEPARLDGRPVAVYFTLTVRFELS